MSIRIAGQVVASAGSLTAHNEDPNAHPDIRELIAQGGGGGSSGSADVAKAVENKNEADTATQPIYHWIGTKAEHEAQNIAAEHPEWIAYITDDEGTSGGGGISGDGYSKEEIDNKFTVVDAAILGNADAIQQTRSDFMEADSELQQQIDALEEAVQGGGGGSAEIPDDVYTADNLIAGNNVTFTEVPPEGGIDEHTLACWHFDGDSKDVISGASFGSNTGINTTYKKFGTASSYVLYAADLSNVKTAQRTIDFWYFNEPSNSGCVLWVGIAAGKYQNDIDGWVVRISNTKIRFGKFKYSGSNWDERASVDYQPSSTEFTHFVAQRISSSVFQIFINGKKIIDVDVETDTLSENLSIDYSGGTPAAFHIDELRISDCVRYTEDFTPPTEPYKVAEGPSKTAVNAIVAVPTKTSELENDSGFLTGLPEGIYTQTNLLGGKDIEIVPEPVEGGIDEHTLACWHFDGNKIDEVSGQSFSSRDYTYQIGKFGNSLYKGSSDNYVFSSNLLSSLNPHTMEEFTIDFWFSFDSSSSDVIVCTGNNATNPSNIYYAKISPFSILLSDSYDGSGYYDIKEKYTFPSTLTYGRYYHVALQVKHFIAKVFFDGKEVISADFTSAGLYSTATGFMVRGFVSKIDELRISDCIRYTENFTPPTEPYRKAEPTGNMVVNFTGESLQKGADYVVESYSDDSGNWYRVYKSGWIEQGGVYVFSGTHGGSYVVNLLVPFINNTYTILRGGKFAEGTASLIGASVISQSEESFTLQYASQSGQKYETIYHWYACGQGA